MVHLSVTAAAAAAAAAAEREGERGRRLGGRIRAMALTERSFRVSNTACTA